MASKKDKKIHRSYYFSFDPTPKLDEISSECGNMSSSMLTEIALYHLINSTPEERAAIIAKYFDPNWPPKDEK